MHLYYRVLVFCADVKNNKSEPWLGTLIYWERTRSVAMSYTYLKTIVYPTNIHGPCLSCVSSLRPGVGLATLTSMCRLVWLIWVGFQNMALCSLWGLRSSVPAC